MSGCGQEVCAQPLQEQRWSWQVNKKKSISCGCWKLKDVPGAARRMSSSPGRLDGPGLPLRGAVWPCCSWEVKKLLRNREKGGVCVPFPGWGFIQAAPTPGMCEEGEGAAPRCLQAGGGTSGQVLALLTWEGAAGW